ncbi:hypothetical protein NPX13_g1218 [Xylaria arbuscula]|uniref:SIR2-like domain-containing protein n=1 Tax=Xylaria arbuscula TaxID=114810 RepID=A0A9W8NLG1_9PEZI|nr:hypothetical protein NPX13_g1218 [Xylaria arbuscula]
MVGSSIADSDGGGGDSLYGPSPKTQPAVPKSPVPDFDHMDTQDPDAEKADSLFGELDYDGFEELEERVPPASESETVAIEAFGYQASAPIIDVTSEGSDVKSPDFELSGAQVSSSGDRKTELADLESKPEDPPPPSKPPSPKATVEAEATAFLAAASGTADSDSPKSSPVTKNKNIDTRQQRRETKKREQERRQSESARIQHESMRILREQLKLGRLAICVGSGVTLYSASTQTSRLSWWGLMSNALDYFEDQASGLTKNKIKKSDLTSARKILLKDDLTEADREDVTNRIQKLLASRVDLETTWMRAQFQNLYRDHVDQLEVLDAIKLLQQQGALLFTTNYDDLLERHCNLEPIDASDPNGLMSYRRGSRPAVFHPHGFWRNANHIVLSAEQYWRVKNDQAVQETLQHILATKTVLFVGCGGGLADPNFGSLINWIGEKNIGTGSSHYILLERSEQNPVTELPLIHLRCEGFDDIPRYLKDLLDPSERREGSLTEIPLDRERKRIHDWLAPADQSEFLNDMMNLHGPNRFDRQLMDKSNRGNGIPAFRRTRDSFAYFFCATYKPYIDEPQVNTHDFNLFLRTIISQLCPPQIVFESLRVLYTDCTRYHPATRPTNEELQKVFIQVMQDLDRPPNPKGHDPLVPGETYLVIDELETLSPIMRAEYAKFIRTITSLQLEHFHLLVTAEDPIAIGLVPPTRPIKMPRGRKGRGRPNAIGLPEMPAASTTKWAEVKLNWNTTETAALEWLRDCFTNDPALVNYANIRQELIYKLNRPNENFRWMYWKLNRLGKIGAGSKLDDKQLKEHAEAALEKDSEDEDEGADAVVADDFYEGSDDDDGPGAGTGSKRRKKQGASPVKKRNLAIRGKPQN